jgi:hypothetical protein
MRIIAAIVGIVTGITSLIGGLIWAAIYIMIGWIVVAAVMDKGVHGTLKSAAYEGGQLVREFNKGSMGE